MKVCSLWSVLGSFPVILIALVILLESAVAHPNSPIGDPIESTGTPTPLGSSIHPIVVVEADIYVNQNRTVARMRCLADDLELLQGVEVLDDGFYDPEELVDATEDHARYLTKHITFRDANGEIMPGRLVDIEHLEYPDEGIRPGQLVNFKVEFEYEFRYDRPPEFITIEHTMGGERILLPAELRVLMKQAGSDVPYSQVMKPNMPETFKFDWDRPALTQAASDQEWEEWFDAQREKSLGLIQYSAVYSFLYINRFDVRHEVLVPLATLTTMMDIERADASFLEVDEQAATIEKIKALFSTINPVKIDGVEVKPHFDRIDFYGLGLADLATQTEQQRVSMANGRAGIIMSYGTKGSPTNIELTWDHFNDVILTVDAVVIAGPQIEKTQFAKYAENNTYSWQSRPGETLPPLTGVRASIAPETYRQAQWSIPLISVGLGVFAVLALLAKGLLGTLKFRGAVALALLVGAVLTRPLYRQQVANPFSDPPTFSIAGTEASRIFAQLHKNLFRAFDYRQESDVYDALAKSVDGPLLRELYLQINQSLKMKEQGGSIARIDEVNVLEGSQQTESAEPDEIGFRYRGRWNLVGTVEHWGHVHQRTNQYEADFTIELVGDSWKITELQMLDEQQGTVRTTLRRF